MGDALTLDTAKIYLSERDTDYFFDLLAGRVDRFSTMDIGLDIDDLIGNYLTEEGARGIDFASWLSGVVEELRENDEREEEAWEDEEEEEEEEEEDDSDDELPELI